MKQFRKGYTRLVKRDILLIFLIIISPLCIYFYKLFPMRVPHFENDFIRLESNYYNDVQAMVYMISTKIVFILIYSIWYVTNKNWWKSIILFPLIFSVYQFVLVVNDEVEYIDDFAEFFYAIVLAIPLIVGLIIISKKLDFYEKSNDLKVSINKEIDDLVLDISKFRTNNFKSLREQVVNLRMQKNIQSKEEYLTKLIKLRDELYNL